MRYHEGDGSPAPAQGQSGAFFVPRQGGGLRTPLDAIVAPNGDLLVDDGEQNAVARFDGRTGASLGNFLPAGNGGLFFPTGMAFSPDHQYFFIASDFNNEIIRFVYDGAVGTQPTTFIASSALGSPAGLIFGPDGNIYVSSLDNSSVVRYDGTTGAPLPAPGQSGATFVPSGSGGIFRCGGLAFGPDGNLYVTSQLTNQIMRYDGTTGDPLPADGQTGAVFIDSDANMHDPAGMIFGPGSDPTSRDIFIISINSNNVLRYDGQTGEFKGEYIPAGSGGLSAPRDIVFGNSDPSTFDYIPPVTIQPGGPLSAVPVDPPQVLQSPPPLGPAISQGAAPQPVPAAAATEPLASATHELSSGDQVAADWFGSLNAGSLGSDLS
jgi:sugar lactone lactonase YvrE